MPVRLDHITPNRFENQGVIQQPTIAKAREQKRVQISKPQVKRARIKVKGARRKAKPSRPEILIKAKTPVIKEF